MLSGYLKTKLFEMFRYSLISIILIACNGTVSMQPSATRNMPLTPSSPYQSEDLTRIASSALSPSLATPPIVSTPIARKYRIKQIESKTIEGVSWSLDGQVIYYAERIKYSQLPDDFQWYVYSMRTGESSRSQPPLSPDFKVWDKQRALPPKLSIDWWLGGRVSSAGDKIVYLKLGDVPTANVKAPANPSSIWIANYDGSNPKRLGSCLALGRITWFDQDTKVIIPCSGESGGPEYLVGDVIKGTLTSILYITNFSDVAISKNYALSFDGKLLAFPDSTFTLRIIPMSKIPISSVTDGGFSPSWSKDNKRLYYLKTEPPNFSCNSIHVYDLTTKNDAAIVEYPIDLPNNQRIDSIPCEGIFAISPLENAAVFSQDGLWLIEW